MRMRIHRKFTTGRLLVGLTPILILAVVLMTTKALQKQLTYYWDEHLILFTVLFSLPAILLFARWILTKNESHYSFYDNPLLIGMAISLIAIPLYFGLPTINLSEKDSNLLQNFIQYAGIPYGFLLAHIFLKVWDQFDKLNRVFDAEVDEVAFLFETILLLGREGKIDILKRKMIHRIYQYVTHVIDYFTQESFVPEHRFGGDNLLRQIKYESLSAIQIIGEDAGAALLSATNNVILARNERVVSTQQRLHGYFWALSVIFTILWVLPFIVIRFESDVFGFFFVIVAIFIGMSILIAIKDLDNPFDGFLRLTPESWKHLSDEITFTIQDIETSIQLNTKIKPRKQRKKVINKH